MRLSPSQSQSQSHERATEQNGCPVQHPPRSSRWEEQSSCRCISRFFNQTPFCTYRRSVKQGCYSAVHSCNLGHLRDGDAKGGSKKIPARSRIMPKEIAVLSNRREHNRLPKSKTQNLSSATHQPSCSHPMDRELKPGFVPGSPPRTTMLLDLKNLKCSACEAIFIYAPLTPRGSGLPFYCPECGACALDAT